MLTHSLPASRLSICSRSTRLLLAGIALLTLAGCATQTPVDDGGRQAGQWERQQADVEAFDTWTLVGKAGLRTPQENTSANLDWNQHPHYFRMLISGPFGGGRSVLEGREGRFSLTTSDGRFEAETPEALMEEQLGWSLPVRAMPDWVRGLPGEHASYQLETDELGFPNHLQQDGWEIDYRDWEQVEGMWLPRRLVMNYGDLRITLVVNQWQSTNSDA
ncbi:lipoprotein insertase outer membrane protein LolB [Vreelandella venusta]|uniref:Outer-membrane lipoprotein LolB n=1 Tax=Vreelandella venusta TaxID=44935 RepID=A0AAQ0CHL2_9GAMM|nr:lipoprotein insertase outer membrane protein LolB [Halomonas venusta]MBR9926323.1 outer membrane lipoprotein LolB [Gammaproteobacteria bacterium]AZM95307.1 outer membrane lipoprotein LolB [Halomonas venusta]MDW0360623.1 lipoprotein insertase outer membrane protein LolB [Halomonas venusta]MDX1355378.1 lipoprotein insertase outer membrane protein LolB [Halomonas venusta]MDX1713384.1 lipoprotein insertase outer membrane protein LolB [Halomonas venusta]